MDIDRKQFLVTLAGGTAALLLGSCGGGDSGGTAGGCTASIAGNHGHVLTIPSADLNSATSITYDITGSADHSHSVTFTAAQLAQLKAGASVTVVSSTNVHSHSITEACM